MKKKTKIYEERNNFNKNKDNDKIENLNMDKEKFNKIKEIKIGLIY